MTGGRFSFTLGCQQAFWIWPAELEEIYKNIDNNDLFSYDQLRNAEADLDPLPFY